MKTLATSLVFMCALTLLAATAFGQITITSSDVNAQLAVGDSLAYKIDKVTSTLAIGVPGQTSWDFSSLRSDSSLTLHSVVVSGTPFTAQFSGATNAFQTSFTYVYSGIPIPVTAYVYFQLSGNLLNLGEGANGSLGPFPGSALISNTPADVFYSLPMTLGTTWTSTYVNNSVFSLNGSVVQQTSVSHSTSYVVDAYGPMTIPGGSVHDALRIKKNDTTAKGIYVGYIFLAKDGASVQVTAANTSQPESGTIQIEPSANWNRQVVPSLPIQLISFNALPNTSGAGVLLRWSTLSEVNNYGFEIQRGAQSGGDFVTVSGAFIPGHGTTTVPQDYSYADVGAPSGTWYYRLKQIDLDGAIHYSDPAKVGVRAGGTALDVPAVFSLGQNFPNPFNPETTIRYSLPSRSHVELAVYNVLGERVAVLAEGEQEGGFHDVRFDGTSLASGVYFYRLRSAGLVQTKRLSLLR
jgi:hypothetical protein